MIYEGSATMFKEGMEKKAVCRDYMRNACFRGDRCKYGHPREKYVFCHDYQNGKCKRDQCVFVHCSRDDEDYYNQFGALPPHLTELPQVSQIPSDSGDVPLCKDFLKGECIRAVCKFRHIVINPSDSYRDSCWDDCEMHPKRRRLEDHVNRYDSQQSSGMVWIPEHEYALLRKTVDDLKKRVEDMQTTNEFLLEQITKMRLGEKTTAGIAAMTVPTVTYTSAPGPMTQVNAAIPTVTASVATVPVSIVADSATPVSLGTVSMAQGAVQIAPPSVSIAQRHDHDTTVTQTLQSLVTYPLVARPVLQAH